MGFKDNFSQAVKELWKKDGQGDNPQQNGGQPSELDRYLQQQNEGQNGVSQRPPQGVEVGNNGVPLETPYYPNSTPNNAQTVAAENAGFAQNQQTQQPSSPENGGINQNVVRATQGMQNMQNVQGVQGMQGMQGVQGAQNMQGGAVQQGAQSAQTSGDVSQVTYNQNVQSIQQNFGQNNPNNPNNQNNNFNQGGYVPPASGGGMPVQNQNETEETTVISKNTVIDGNVRSLANMQIDGNIKGNVETTRNIDMSGKIVGDITCNNAGMNSAAMQGNVSLKGRMRMDRDTILIGDLSSQYADINGRIRGKLDIVGKAELKRDAIVFGDINASTIAVTDGAIIQGYVNTTFLSKEDSRNAFPEAISFDGNKEGQKNTPNT